MKKMSCVWLMIVAVMVCSYASAQSKLSIDKVYSVSLRNSGAIITNNEVKGYFLFYQSDKVDRKNYEYTLQILDENLNKVKDIRFTDSKSVTLLEASFNGGNLMFAFFDKDNKMLEYRSYGFDGKMAVSYERDLDKRSIRYMETKMAQLDEESQNSSLYAVEGSGFISCIPIREDGQYTYEVNFYNGEKRSQWTYNPETGDKFEAAQYLGSSDSVAVFQVTRKRAMLAGKYESWLLGISLAKGKTVFEFQTENKDKYNFMPMNVATVAGQEGFVLSGPYFNSDDNVLKDKSLGMGIWVMNNRGQIMRSKYSSWETDLAKFLPVNSKGKIDDIGYLFIHKVVRTSDDKIFAIAEGYKQQASALGIATTILSRGNGASTVKLKITDMVALEFDNAFNLKNATVYDKNNNNVEFPGGADFMGPQVMAMMAKYNFDAFDYEYTQISSDRSSYVVGYKDYVKEDGYKGGTFNSISYYNGKFTTDKINLKSSASALKVLPGRTGSVVVLEYYKKDKRMEMRLEKLN
jgi:hypothetical protein